MSEKDLTLYRKLILDFPLPTLLVHLRTELIETANSVMADITGIQRSKLENTFLNNIGFSQLTARMLLQTKRFADDEENQAGILLTNHSGRQINLMAMKRDVKFSGELYRLLIFVDFTNMHDQMHRALANEEKYRRIFDITPVMYMISRASDGTVTDINAALCNLLKKNRHELLGKKTTEIAHGWDPEARAEIADRMNRYGFVNNFETTFTDHTGVQHATLSSIHKITSDNEPSFLVCTVDITQLKKAESDLQMAKLSLDTAAELIFWIHEDGLPRYVNQTACELLGYSERELREISLINLDLTLTEQEFSQIKQTSSKRSVTRETALLKKDGTTLPVEVTVKIFRHMNQSILAFTARDISTRKADDEKRADTQKQISELNRAKDKIFSIIGHDLRGPLNGILSLTEFLTSSHVILSREEVKVYGEHIHNAASEGYHLLEDLLLWAQLQTGHEKVSAVGTRLRDIALESTDLYRFIIEKKRVNFINDIDKEIMVRADKRLLRTIYRNLILNALKFVNDKGTVRLSAQAKGKTVTIAFENDGAGLSKDIIERILEKSNAAEFKGTGTGKKIGFGLFISREMAEMSGSKLVIKSEQTKGATLTLNLPLVIEKAENHKT